MIQPCYDKGERGNKLYLLETMLRLYLLQNLFELSDEATAAEAIDSRAFSEFCGIDSSNQVQNGDAHQVKEGNTWHFGYKAHIGVDEDIELVHTVEATPANVHDVSQTSSLLTGEEEVVYSDSGYLGAGKREDAIVRNKAVRKIKYKINRRPSQIKKLSRRGQYAAKKTEHAKSSVRVKAEHVFGVVKRQLRFRKTRYRRLEKQKNQIQYHVRISESASG